MLRSSCFRIAAAALLLTVVAGSRAETQSAVRASRPRTRTYFIAADEVTWDYVAGGRDEIAGQPYVDSAFFAQNPPKAVSSEYKKVLYREYTDSTFAQRKARPAEWEHLGFLGPVIHAWWATRFASSSGTTARRPYSVHPHGVFYEKDSEGAPYNDGSSGADKADDAVPPGGTHVYVWQVPERAGPGPDGRQLGHVDVPLARRRGARHRRRSARRDDHHRARHGASGRHAEGRRPRARRPRSRRWTRTRAGSLRRTCRRRLAAAAATRFPIRQRRRRRHTRGT